MEALAPAFRFQNFLFFPDLKALFLVDVEFLSDLPWQQSYPWSDDPLSPQFVFSLFIAIFPP